MTTLEQEPTLVLEAGRADGALPMRLARPNGFGELQQAAAEPGTE